MFHNGKCNYITIIGKTIRVKTVRVDKLLWYKRNKTLQNVIIFTPPNTTCFIPYISSIYIESFLPAFTHRRVKRDGYDFINQLLLCIRGLFNISICRLYSKSDYMKNNFYLNINSKSNYYCTSGFVLFFFLYCFLTLSFFKFPCFIDFIYHESHPSQF